MSYITVNEKNRLRQKRNTTRKGDFTKMRKWFPERLNVVSEGDSWFAYPPNWLVGKPSNLIDHISGWTRRKANFYSMASNGDEAVDMVSGKQKHDLVDILRWHTKDKHRKPIDLLLFSGGGNDLVGENDFERFLKPYRPGKTAEQCVNLNRLKRKSRQIGLAYEELIDIRDHYSPSTIIVTHTYDYPYPSLTGAVLLGGLIKTKAWMKRFMDGANIPDNLQTDVIKIFMDQMAEVSLRIKEKRSKFIVVDTRKTLIGKKHWLNEIHPDGEGFKKIAAVIFKEVEKIFPGLKRV
jgi:hypothetical protein